MNDIVCRNCGAKNDITEDSKRWIIRMYEAGNRQGSAAEF